MPADDIRMQIAQTESQIDSCGALIRELQEKINELKRIKPVVTAVKHDIGNQRLEIPIKAASPERWNGVRYREYSTILQETVMAPLYTYYQEVDRILDSINDEITRMENAILQQQGLIGNLKALCNSLWNELRNLFN